MTTTKYPEGSHHAPGAALRLLGYDDLKARGIRYSRVHLFRLIDAGKFPAPIQVGPSRRAWVEAEIDEWMEARMAERQPGGEAA